MSNNQDQKPKDDFEKRDLLNSFYYAQNGDKIREEYGIPSERVAAGYGKRPEPRTPFYFDPATGSRIREDYGIPSENIAVGYSDGPTINGKKPEKLIDEGTLTPETIKEEDKMTVFYDIMLGVTMTKTMLEKKIALIISNPDIIKKMLNSQYHLAVEEMRLTKRNFHLESHRVLDFLSTVNILKDMGVDFDQLSFEDEKTKDLTILKLLQSFKEKTNEFNAPSIPDPTNYQHGGFVDILQPLDKNNSPYLFTGTLIDYFIERQKDKEQSQQQEFKNARDKQMKQDQIVRGLQLSEIIIRQETSKKGPDLQ